VEGLNSNLNLNAGVPPRVQPRLGDWGPAEVPSTRQKKRMRWWAVLAFLATLLVIVGYGYYIYLQVR